MKIAVIGANNVGRALAEKWAAAGHSIWVGTRNPENTDLKELKATNPATITLTSVEDAVSNADVVLLSTVPQTTLEIAEELGDMSNKVLIDAMNTVRARPEPYENTFEALRAWTGCQQLVKCFNTTGYENIENTNYQGLAVDMFMAGDSQRAKSVARQLAKDAGFEECYDFGGNDKVALLESFGLAWINLAITQNLGRGIAFKLLKR